MEQSQRNKQASSNQLIQSSTKLKRQTLMKGTQNLMRKRIHSFRLDNRMTRRMKNKSKKLPLWKRKRPRINKPKLLSRWQTLLGCPRGKKLLQRNMTNLKRKINLRRSKKVIIRNLRRTSNNCSTNTRMMRPSKQTWRKFFKSPCPEKSHLERLGALTNPSQERNPKKNDLYNNK